MASQMGQRGRARLFCPDTDGWGSGTAEEGWPTLVTKEKKGRRVASRLAEVFALTTTSISLLKRISQTWSSSGLSSSTTWIPGAVMSGDQRWRSRCCPSWRWPYAQCQSRWLCPPHHGVFNLDEVEHGDVAQLRGKLSVQCSMLEEKVWPSLKVRVVTWGRHRSLPWQSAGPTEICPLSLSLWIDFRTPFHRCELIWASRVALTCSSLSDFCLNDNQFIIMIRWRLIMLLISWKWLMVGRSSEALKISWSHLNYSTIFSGNRLPLYFSPAISTSRTLEKWEEKKIVSCS